MLSKGATGLLAQPKAAMDRNNVPTTSTCFLSSMKIDLA
jgi:hypothetical protein